MRLQRISVLMTVTTPPAGIESLAPVFRDWVREHRLTGSAVDVMTEPGGQRHAEVVLVGMEGDVAVQDTGRRTVLRYTLKRARDGEAAQHIVLALGRLLEAAGEVERDTGLLVDRSSVTVYIADRRNAPNTAQVRGSLQSEVVSAVTSTLGFVAPDIIGGSVDPRDPLSWTIRSATASLAA